MRRALVSAGSAVVFCGLFVLIPACSGQGARGVSDAPPPDAVAVVGGQVITKQELESFLTSALAPLRDQEYKIKNEGIKTMVFRRLVELEAGKLGVSPEAYHRREVIEKAGEPAEADIQATINQYRAQLPRDEAEARGRVLEFLRGQKVQEREAALRAELMDRHQVRILLDPPRVTVPVSADDLAKGPAGAPVVIVEYSDYGCPYCKRSQEVLRQVKETYGDQVRLVFRHFPLNPNTRKAAEAALCAGDQGKFWELHDRLFAHQGELNLIAVQAAAGTVEMDMNVFNACLDGGIKAREVVKNMSSGQGLGVSGTPAFFVNGRLLSGAQPFAAFKEVIDDELRRADGARSPK